MRFPTKIPTIVGLLLLTFFVGGFIVAFERLVRLPSVASQNITPAKVEITNVSDTNFTVSWITDALSTGALIVSANGKNQVVFDERDLPVGNAGISGKLGSYLTHTISYRTAMQDTDYSIKIISNGKTFLDDGKPYHIRTGPTLSSSTSGLEPAYGTVVTATDQPAIGALVYLTIEGGQKLSTLVTTSGSWLIPLNLVRTQDLSTYVSIGERITEQIFIRSETEESSAITDTLNDSPVPQIQLGKTYDFRRQQAQGQVGSGQALNGNSKHSLALNPSDVLGETTQLLVNGKVTITKPAQGQALPTTLPLIQGTGIPGKLVSLVLGITHPIGGTSVVAADGIWRYTPTKPLTPGRQSVTVTSVGTKGQPVALTRTFEILKEGSQVLGVATPSATLTPALTPTRSASTSPTPTSTLSGEAIPETGSSLPTIILIILGLGLLTSGAVVFIK